MSRKNDIRKPSIKRDMLVKRDIIHELRSISASGDVEKFEALEPHLHDVHRNIHPKKGKQKKPTYGQIKRTLQFHESQL